MNIKPIGDRILVEPLKQEDVTVAGIVLPDSAGKQKKSQGKIIALGSGEEIKKLGLKEGDTVVFGQYAGEEIEVDKKQLRILYVGGDKECEVLAVIE